MILAGAGLAATAGPAAAVSPTEKEVHYRIEGKTGAALYASIGEKGPEISGGRRSIAHTTFKLTWRRDYREQADGSCLLASAVPRLVITYTLPKPAGKLPAEVASSWRRFRDGLAAHERVHGRHIVEMVEAITAVSTGLSAPDDPGCAKVRAKLQAHLKALSDAQRARGRAFDQTEMGDGGAIQRLVLDLVNGP